MNEPLLNQLAAAIERSDLIRASGRREADEQTRPLRESEIRELVANGNTAEGWHRIRVVEGFRTVRIRNSDFRGNVVLGLFEGTTRGPGGEELPSGIYRSVLMNCEVRSEALVRNVGLLSGYVIDEHACVSDCGRVVCGGPTTFGGGVSIPIGPQIGGRSIRPFAEITLDLVNALVGGRVNRKFTTQYQELLTLYLDRIRSSRGVIGKGAIVAHVPVVQNAYIGASAEVDAANRIENATLLSLFEEPVRVCDGACVVDSLLQWGSRVTGPTVVERSLLLQQAEVGRFGKVTDSVIGPSSSVESCEVTTSLVGPFVGCHHQGLLIAARWPGGRGNIGYGAGVGCNHTSRAPDQEALLGEGLFVGLGAKLQYPIDLSQSPYTVLACGVNLPPQRIEFPFSLVRPNSEPLNGAPAGANILIPAWMLAENLYSVQRSALKFRSRDRAPRHRLSHAVFRPEVMALVADARTRLESVAEIRQFYTDQDIPGLGRNILLECHRLAAVRSYSDHLERCRLLALLESGSGSVGATAWQETPEALRRLTGLMEEFGLAVERSKGRDEGRGEKILDDYFDSHTPTHNDPVVRQTWDEVHRVRQQIAQMLVVMTQIECPTVVNLNGAMTSFSSRS